MRQQPRAAPRVPPASLPVSPNMPFTSRHPQKTSSARITSRPAACPQPTYRRALPTVSSSQEGPFPYFQRYASGPEASAREEKRQKNSGPLHSPAFPLLPPRPYGMSHFKPPPASDGDRRTGLRKVFSGMGRAREGKGQFLQKTPLPLSSSPCSTAFPQQKKRGSEWPAPAFTGKTKER